MLRLLPALLALAALAACGYQQDVPRLPGGAHSIAVQEVANQTDTGELDLRLRVRLEHRLAQQAHLRVTTADQAALVLTVRLDSLLVTRGLDPTVTDLRHLTHRLVGHITLRDRYNGRKFMDQERIMVEVKRVHDPAVQETPAIRDEALNDTLDAFAEQVEQRLFRTF